LLIDENLSPALVVLAHRRGFEAMHVNHLGLRTETDWDLLKVVADQDWVLVTNNAIEFRRRYGKVDLHPGVIFLLPSVRRPEQVRLFLAALEHLRFRSDMINRALDVAFDASGHISLISYDLP
jgi:predicted nuclease of predicted toxin-antitoxin system